MANFFLALLFLVSSPVAAAELKAVSLIPSSTEILFALGIEPVGVSNFCDYPARAASVEKVGDLFSPNIEKIASLHPDVVFAGEWKTSSARRRLEKLGIKVVSVPDATSVEDIFSCIMLIGEAGGKRKQAKSLVGKIRAELASFHCKISGTKPKVYVELDHPHWTAGAASYISDLLRLAGAENIFSDISKGYAQVSWEQIADRNPDVIIDLSPNPADYNSLPDAANLKALRGRAVVTGLDRNLLVRPSARIPRALRVLCDGLKK